MRLFFAILLCKLVSLALRLAGRGGFPYTTLFRSCRMLEQMARDAGFDCFANRSGSNLERGIAADFAANASLFGKPRRRFAVIECDEAAFRRVCGEVKPAVAVVTNIFRDQLDRYGEVTHTLAGIREGLARSPETRVCLNADCSLTSSLAPDRKSVV